MCNLKQTSIEMKRTIKNILYTSVILYLFTGCYLQSVHPLVPFKDAILLDKLEGRWESGDQRWTFINDPSHFTRNPFGGDIEMSEEDKKEFESLYLIILEDLQSSSEDSVLLVGSIGKFNDEYFIDLSLFHNDESKVEGYYNFPVHLFSKINIENEVLSLEYFESSWIKHQIENNRVRIKHEQNENGNVLITASTKELQKFVTKYSDDPKAFDEPLNLRRSSNAL